MEIVLYPHPALRSPARPLAAIDEQVRSDAAEMLVLMYRNHGVGLSANQVALPYQIIVLNPTGDPHQKDHEQVLVNPVILEQEGSVEGQEGCLSLPEVVRKVERAKTVKVQAYNLDGQAIQIELHDRTARILQHEIDHLHGVLIIDKPA